LVFTVKPMVKETLELGETPAKLLKLDADLLKDLLACQQQIGSLENDCQQEQAKLQQAFDVKKQPALRERGEFYKAIPHFWMTVLDNMSSLSDHVEICAEESPILEFLEDIQVEEFQDVNVHKHTFTFKFKPNEYFEETVLKKSVMNGDFGEDTLTMTVPDITWKKNPLDTESAADREKIGFFDWVSSESSVDEDFGHIFRNHVWGNPMAMYREAAESDDDDDDDEEEEGEDGDGDDEEGAQE